MLKNSNIIKRECRDVDDLNKNMLQGSIENFQIEPGNFFGTVHQWISKDVITGVHFHNRSVLRTGSIADRYTAFLIPGNLNLYSNDSTDPGADNILGIFKDGEKLFGISPGKFSRALVSIRSEYLGELLLKRRFKKDLINTIKKNEALKIRTVDTEQLQCLIRELVNSDKINAEVLQRYLPNLLLDALERNTDVIPKRRTGARWETYQKALFYIFENLTTEFSTNFLSQVLNTSERNLRYIFKEFTGLSPMKFIKTIRLNLVRKAIKRNQGEANIGVIASDLGFTHTGQFAKDYKGLFNEYPSETQSMQK